MPHRMPLAWTLTLTLLITGAALAETTGEPAVDEQLDTVVSAIFALDLAPGMGVSVVKGDELIYAKGFGHADVEAGRPVTTETLFYIASTTKSFTALAAAQLAERGELDLDAPLSRYLPQLELKPPLSADKISLRELLTHTHGIADDGPIVLRTAYSGEHDNDLLIELLSRYPPSPTGKQFVYGNLGYNIAGLVMDTELDTDWKEILDREVFAPLKMKDTTAYISKVDRQRLAMPYGPLEVGFRPLRYGKEDSNMHAAGGHVTTVLDLARYLEAHLNEGQVDGRQVLPASVIAETHRLQATQDREFGPYHRHGWGLGWDLGTYDDNTLIHRFGGFAGFRSHVSFMPEHALGVVVLVNESSMGSRLADLVATQIYDLLLGIPDAIEKHEQALAEYRERAVAFRQRVGQTLAERAARPQTLPHPLSSYEGSYENSDYGRMEWRIVDGQLEAAIGIMQSAATVFDGPKNQLRVELQGGGQVVEFRFPENTASAASLLYDDQVYDRVIQSDSPGR